MSKASHPCEPDLESLGAQEFTLQLQIATVSAQGASGSDDPVARCGRVARLAHDRADGAPGAR